jgi:hypothetical protein
VVGDRPPAPVSEAIAINAEIVEEDIANAVEAAA